MADAGSCYARARVSKCVTGVRLAGFPALNYHRSVDLLDALTLLGLDQAANRKSVDRAYRLLARRWHPDLCGDDDAAQRFHALAQARDVVLANLESLAASVEVEYTASVPTQDRGEVPGTHNAWRELGLGLRSHSQAGWRSFVTAASACYRFARPRPYMDPPVLVAKRKLSARAHLAPEHARCGVELPFRYALGAELLAKRLQVPPGAKDGQVYAYEIASQAGSFGLVLEMKVG